MATTTPGGNISMATTAPGGNISMATTTPGGNISMATTAQISAFVETRVAESDDFNSQVSFTLWSRESEILE